MFFFARSQIPLLDVLSFSQFMLQWCDEIKENATRQKMAILNEGYADCFKNCK